LIFVPGAIMGLNYLEFQGDLIDLLFSDIRSAENSKSEFQEVSGLSGFSGFWLDSINQVGPHSPHVRISAGAIARKLKAIFGRLNAIDNLILGEHPAMITSGPST
jgi:hypothetical protein